MRTILMGDKHNEIYAQMSAKLPDTLPSSKGETPMTKPPITQELIEQHARALRKELLTEYHAGHYYRMARALSKWDKCPPELEDLRGTLINIMAIWAQLDARTILHILQEDFDNG